MSPPDQRDHPRFEAAAFFLRGLRSIAESKTWT